MSGLVAIEGVAKLNVDLDLFADVCAQNVRLRDKLLEIASECAGCGGTGCVTVSTMRRRIEVERVLPCGDCADIRETLR